MNYNLTVLRGERKSLEDTYEDYEGDVSTAMHEDEDNRWRGAFGQGGQRGWCCGVCS